MSVNTVKDIPKGHLFTNAVGTAFLRTDDELVDGAEGPAAVAFHPNEGEFGNLTGTADRLDEFFTVHNQFPLTDHGPITYQEV